MIANFFNKTNPINFLVLSVMLFFAYLFSMIIGFSGDYSISYFFKKSFYFLLVIFMLFILDFIIRKNLLTNKNTYALWFYVLFFSFFPYSLNNSNLLVAQFFLLLAFRKIYSLRTSYRIKEKIFDSAFWISIASMFYDWSLLYLILVYIAILQFQKDEWRNLIIPLIGIITPVFLLYVYLLVTNELNILSEYWEFSMGLNFDNYLEIKFLLPIILSLIVVLISIVPTTKKALSAKLDFKSIWILLIFHILISLFLVFISPTKNGSEFSFLFFPLSILFANYLENIEKYWYKELIMYIYIILFVSVYVIW